MENLPITDREILVRYGKLAPHARDRVLDQFYLLVPGSSSFKLYMMKQSATIIVAFLSLFLALIAIFSGLETMGIRVAWLTPGLMLPVIAIIVQVSLALNIFLRRRKQYRKRYRQRLLQPTELGISRERINLHSRVIHGGCVLSSMLWHEVTSVELVDREEHGTTSTLIELRNENGQSIALHLDYLQTIEERQILRDALRAFVKNVDVGPAAARLMKIGNKDDVPFTRLWCQALQDARPRVHNAPLVSDVTLQNGRFRVIECVGGGGQGTVYAADANELDGTAKVVLKEYVLPDFDHTEAHKNACEQFEKEIRLLSRIEHKGVIKLIDAFVEDHRAYLVLDYINGVSLRQHVERHGSIDERSVVELGVQLCEILNYLHTMTPRIMHLDFSPENILYSTESGVTLIDFNISIEENALRTRTVMGKQRYMAPEQYRGRPTPKSDIYSLGATLFYLLTGREPEPISVARTSRHLTSVDSELDRVIAKLTAMEEEDRHESAAQVRDVLAVMVARLRDTKGGAAEEACEASTHTISSQ